MKITIYNRRFHSKGISRENKKACFHSEQEVLHENKKTCFHSNQEFS
jgi:hypothetical protein